MFEYNATLAHRRTCSLKFVDVDEKVEHLVTPETHKFAKQAELVSNHDAKEHLKKFDAIHLTENSLTSTSSR